MKQAATVLLLLAIFVSAGFAQAIDIPLTVRDNAGASKQVRFGLDPTATDGINAMLSEKELPPLPPAGVFDARFIGADISVPALGNGSWRDYRQGTTTFSGTKTHEIQYQVGLGTSIIISWTLPAGVTGTIQDLLGGIALNKAMTGTDSVIVTNPGIINRLKLMITYTPVVPPVTNIVLNGGFESGTTQWRYYQNGTGNSFGVVTTAPIPEGISKARIVLGSSIGTNNQIWQQGLTLEANTAYRITFAYHASASTNFRVRVIEQDDDYTVYGFNWKYLYPTTNVQTYVLDFTTANFTGTVTDAMVQFYFVGGTASRTIYLDNVIIAKTGGGLAKEGDVPVTAPAEFRLMQNFPNPFNPSTRISFTLPAETEIKLVVYNVLGEMIQVLANGEMQAGYHEIVFEAGSLPSGLYFYRLESARFNEIKKMILMK